MGFSNSLKRLAAADRGKTDIIYCRQQHVSLVKFVRGFTFRCDSEPRALRREKLQFCSSRIVESICSLRTRKWDSNGTNVEIWRVGLSGMQPEMDCSLQSIGLWDFSECTLCHWREMLWGLIAETKSHSGHQKRGAHSQYEPDASPQTGNAALR